MGRRSCAALFVCLANAVTGCRPGGNSNAKTEPPQKPIVVDAAVSGHPSSLVARWEEKRLVDPPKGFCIELLHDLRFKPDGTATRQKSYTFSCTNSVPMQSGSWEADDETLVLQIL